MPGASTTVEWNSLAEAHDKEMEWTKWGPYLSERQWGTVSSEIRVILSPYGIRALSRYHRDHPYVLNIYRQEYRIAYLPADPIPVCSEAIRTGVDQSGCR